MPNHRTAAPWSRRELLRLLGAATLAAPAIAAGCARRGADDEIGAASRDALWRAGIVPEGDAAARLGQLFRDLHPDQRSIAGLCRELGGDPLPTSAEAWRAAAARQLRADFEAGRSIELDGWIVTSTEARLLALASSGNGEYHFLASHASRRAPEDGRRLVARPLHGRAPSLR